MAERAPQQPKALPEDPFLAALDAVERDDQPLTAEVIAATEAGDRPSR